MSLTKRQLEKREKRIKILELEIENDKLLLEELKKSNNEVHDNTLYESIYNNITNSRQNIKTIENSIKSKLIELKNLPNKINQIKDKEYNIWTQEIERIDSKIEDNKIIEFDKLITLDFNKYNHNKELTELKDNIAKLSQLGNDKINDKRGVLTSFVKMRCQLKKNNEIKKKIDLDIENTRLEIAKLDVEISRLPKLKRQINNDYYKLDNDIKQLELRVDGVQNDIDILINNQDAEDSIEDKLISLISEKDGLTNQIMKIKKHPNYDIMKRLKQADVDNNSLIKKKEWYCGKINRLTNKKKSIDNGHDKIYNQSITQLNVGISEINNVKEEIKSLKKQISDCEKKIDYINNEIDTWKDKLSCSNKQLDIERIRANKRYDIMMKRIGDMELNGECNINQEIKLLQQNLSQAKLNYDNAENGMAEYDIKNGIEYKKYIKNKTKILNIEINLKNKEIELNRIRNSV